MAGKIAKKNEKVVINRDFSLIVPEGYCYSTAKNEINGNRKLVFIKTERNALFEKEYADFAEYDLDAPFAAPQCMTVMEPRGLGAELDLSDSNVRTALRQMAEQLMTMFGGTVATAKESKDILVYYMKFKGKETNTHFMIATAANIYNGQIWINDVATQKERTELAKQWLTTVENYILTDADKVPVEPFVAPTYNDSKRWRMGTLTVAVPDYLTYLGAEDNDFGSSMSSMLALKQLMDEYAFLAVPKNYEGGFQDCHNAPLSFNCQRTGIVQSAQIASLWLDTESIQVDRKTTFTDMVKNALDGMGRGEYPIHYKKLADKLDVVYAQSGERDDPIEYWRSYFIAFFHNDTIHQVNVHINAKKDVKAFDKAVEDWISRVKPATGEEIAQYEKEKTIKALGPLAGSNGKIDGAKGTQLFFEDVFFFVKGQLLAKGKHHELKGIQVNAQAIDNYPQIKENISIFGTALTELINFVEQDELLVLDEECVHYAFDKLNRIDPMIVNGTTVDVKGAKIGKGLSGARIFLLIAWHMIKIVEGEENTYIVALDQNIFKGIPNATAYVLQFIKRLREYNGRTDGFSAVFASTFNLDGGINGAISGRNPLASHASMDAIKVAQGKDPYATVQKEITEAKSKGVWDNWKRGRGMSDDDDDDFGPMDFGGFEIGEEDPFDLLPKAPDVDGKGRIAPTDVMTSANVKKAIKDIGAVGKSITIKGKTFVLTELMYPDILEKYIIENGGEVKSFTVLATDYLIIGDNGNGDTTKAKKALELNKTRGKNIKALSENDFWRMVADTKASTAPKKEQNTRKASSLAEEIVAWFKADDQLHPLADIQAHFSTHSKAEIKKALDMLCGEDVLYGGENIIGNMYGLVSLENADDFLCRAPLMAPAITPSPSVKDDAAQKKAEEQALAERITAMEKKRWQVESNIKAARSALSDIQSDRKAALREFERAKQKIERMSSRSINIYSYNMDSIVREIIETANGAGRLLSNTCINLAKKLDQKCKPYIDEGMDSSTIKAIADELQELNETAVVDVDFTGSFEGTSFGHVGNIHFEPTREAKKIAEHWRFEARAAKSGNYEDALLEEFGISKSEYQRHCNYESAVASFNRATTSAQFARVKKDFGKLKGYLQAESYIQKCEKKIPALMAKEEKAAAERVALEAKKRAEEKERALKAELQRKEAAYATARELMEQNTAQGYEDAAKKLKEIAGYQDADVLAEQCLAKAEICRKEQNYETAKALMINGTTSEELFAAATSFSKLGSYLDAKELSSQCKKRANILKEEERKQSLYDEAKKEAKQEQQQILEKAAVTFESLGDWKDAAEQARIVRKKIEEIQEAERKRQIEFEKKVKKQKIVKALIITAVVFVLAALIVYMTVLAPAEKYERAIALLNDGDYVAAVELFKELGNNYKQTSSYMAQMHEKDPLLRFRLSAKGDVITLGKYDHGDAVQDIEWYVLQKTEDRVLLVSKYILDAMPFHNVEEDVLWEDSDLCKWMKNTFYSEAFSEGEKQYTEVFLPRSSKMQAYYEELFGGCSSIYMTKPTKLALSKGIEETIWYDKTNHGYLWWLADDVYGYKWAGSMRYTASTASAGEAYRFNGVANAGDILGFRPFVWVTID